MRCKIKIQKPGKPWKLETSVSQKTDAPFGSLGVDHAGEQDKKVLRIDSGNREIANNTNARD